MNFMTTNPNSCGKPVIPKLIRPKMWQEGVNPFVMIELLSPGTENDDLGEKLREIGKPPMKWEVYERILRVPF